MDVEVPATRTAPGERKFVNCAGCNAELPSHLIATRIHIDARHAPLCGTCADVPKEQLIQVIREEMARLRESRSYQPIAA